MKTPLSLNRVSFNELPNLFSKDSEDCFVLKPYYGQGHLQIFNLAIGLKARFWDCRLKKEIELFGEHHHQEQKSSFTIAFFPDTEAIRLVNKDSSLKEPSVWDTIFICSNSNYKMKIKPGMRAQFVSISFSEEWFNTNVLEPNDCFKILKEKIFNTTAFSLLETMNTTEKNAVKELLEFSWKKSLGSFYIKSCVLKIISDFFHKIKDRETLSIVKPCVDTVITEVEKYLSDYLKGSLPNLTEVSDKFSISKSTLMRHFKKKHGVNISTYFTRKKIEYVDSLTTTENRDV